MITTVIVEKLLLQFEGCYGNKTKIFQQVSLQKKCSVLEVMEVHHHHRTGHNLDSQPNQGLLDVQFMHVGWTFLFSKQYPCALSQAEHTPKDARSSSNTCCSFPCQNFSLWKFCSCRTVWALALQVLALPYLVIPNKPPAGLQKSAQHHLCILHSPMNF